MEKIELSDFIRKLETPAIKKLEGLLSLETDGNAQSNLKLSIEVLKRHEWETIKTYSEFFGKKNVVEIYVSYHVRPEKIFVLYTDADSGGYDTTYMLEIYDSREEFLKEYNFNFPPYWAKKE